jgi:hypothetical protein
MKTETRVSQQTPSSKPFTTRDELGAFLINLSNGAVVANVDITARCADQIIADDGWNVGNRRVHEVSVQKFKRDMDTGNWVDNLTPIMLGYVNNQWRIGDGQHRLNAQARSGKTLRYVVKFYTDFDDYSAAAAKVDAGRARSRADLVKILGLSETSFQHFERITNAMMKFEGRPATASSNHEWLQYANDHIASLTWAVGLPTRLFKAHVLAALTFAHAKSRSSTMALIDNTISGAGLTAGAPALVLKNGLSVLNEARRDAEKTQAIIRVLRICDDARRGRAQSALKSRKASPSTIDAVAYFVSPNVARAHAGVNAS